MYLSENLKETLQRLYESTEKVIKRANFITEENMEEFLYKLEKRRYEIYNYREVMNAEKERDRENDYEEVEEMNDEYQVGEKYKTSYENGVLKITIPDKLPNLKYKPTYTQSIILRSVMHSCRQYEGLFLDDFVILIVKVYETTKKWDADNRTIKPIQDGLVYAHVIRDDSIFNSCYMVQGFKSEENYIEVFVTKADKTINLINESIYKKTNEKWQKNDTETGKNELEEFFQF